MLQLVHVIHEKLRNILKCTIFSFFCVGFFLFIVQIFLRICTKTSVLWIDKSVSYFLVLSSLMASSYAVSENGNIKILLFPAIGNNPFFRWCIQLLGFIVSMILLGIFLIFSQLSWEISWIQTLSQIPYLLCFSVSAISYLCIGIQPIQDEDHPRC